MKMMKLVQSSLNLRVEQGHTPEDYILPKQVVDEQLEKNADIYSNVEFMECRNEEYLDAFTQAGYVCYPAVFGPHKRGILCAARKEYEVEEIYRMEAPHFLHLRLHKAGEHLDLVVIRLLVAGGNDEDFQNRFLQWTRVMEYIKSLKDTSHLVVTGDFNHGVISDTYKGRPRQHYNYQMVVRDLKSVGVDLAAIDGYSYKDFLKIDHIASGSGVKILNAAYEDPFAPGGGIGIPDHKLLVAQFQWE